VVTLIFLAIVTLSRLCTGAILAFTSICSTFDSAIFSSSTGNVARVFGVGVEVATLSSSLYILGYACGPLVWAPFSELQGRRLPILIGMFGFGIFNIAVAVAKDLQTLLISRFFSGVFGSCPLAVVAAIFSDIFDNRSRGIAIAMFSSMVFLGPLLAPFIGGFINMSYLGWRWTAYIPAIMGFAALILNFFFLKESYPPVILIYKAAQKTGASTPSRRKSKSTCRSYSLTTSPARCACSCTNPSSSPSRSTSALFMGCCTASSRRMASSTRVCTT
jgi:DHA1 family multidrug resistance protein-like MFS transporter